MTVSMWYAQQTAHKAVGIATVHLYNILLYFCQLYFCLSVCLSACCVSVHCIYVCLFVSACPSLCLSVCLSLSLCVSVSLSVSLFLSCIYIYTTEEKKLRSQQSVRVCTPFIRLYIYSIELVRVPTDSCICIYMQTVNAVFEPRKLDVHAVQYKVTLDIS